MPLPFDLQRFSSEILTGVAVFLIDRVPKAWRWVRDRVRPDPELPNLLISIADAEFQIRNFEEGEATIWLDIVNLTRRRLELQEFQIQSLQFNGGSLPQPALRIVPIRVDVSKSAAAKLTVYIRLQKPDIEAISRLTIQAPNVRSTPGHNIRIGLVCVISRRFFRKTLSRPRYLDRRLVSLSIPTNLLPSLPSSGSGA